MSNIESLLRSLTLEEKITLLSGENFWATSTVADNVPSAKVSDGPSGVRGGSLIGVTSAACFPAGVCLAATFDPTLVYQVGAALAEEAKTKGVNCVLGPTTCIQRHVLGGRNFESFSEDPLLSGKLASKIIQGLQENNVAATLKHYAANEQETERMRVDTIISERTLREIYLRPFEIAVKEAQPWAVMTAYNSVNGEHCDSNGFLLQKVLRGEWKFDGLVMSDWGGTNSTAAALNTGLDLEMPGPSASRQVSDVLKAIEEGILTVTTIDDRVRAVLKFLERVRAFENTGTSSPELAVNQPKHQKLIREAGSQGLVLLKNDQKILPLTNGKVTGKKIALLGLAKTAIAHGGGSAAVKPHYKVAAWDAFQTAVGNIAELSYSKGAHTERFLAPMSYDGTYGTLLGEDGKPGWTRFTYDQDTNELENTIHGQENVTLSPFRPDMFRRTVEFVCQFSPLETGPHYLGISGVGTTQLYINDELVMQQVGTTPDPMGFLFGVQEDSECVHNLSAGASYKIRVKTLPTAGLPGLEFLEGRPGLRLGFCPAAERDADLLQEAVQLASAADFAIVFTGHEPSWETEGQDQQSFDLPRNGSQNALVAAVAACNSNTIVVNSTGVPIAMPWLGDVAAVVQAWFTGQEAGNAIVDVILGKVNPEGKLPVTFPKRLEDTPAFSNFPGTYENYRPIVEYKEGVFVGYRYYDRQSGDMVIFPFGYGLSYTSFGYEDLKVERVSEDLLSVALRVQNTGECFGGTVLQIYAGYSEADPAHPLKSLIAFEKIRLQAGQTHDSMLSLPMRELAYFDESRGMWVVRAGEYEVMVGHSAMDIALSAKLRIEEECLYQP